MEKVKISKKQKKIKAGFFSLDLSKPTKPIKSPIRKLLFLYEEQFTPHGKPLLLMAIVTWSLGNASTDVLLYLIGGLLFGFLISTLLQGFPHRPRALDIERIEPRPVTSNMPTKWKLRLTNRGKRPLMGLEFIENLNSQNYEISILNQIDGQLNPGKSLEVPIEATFPRRGFYEFSNPLLYSTYPYNLFRWKKEGNKKGNVIVYPAYRYLEDLDLRFGRKYQQGGIILSSNVGDSAEFMGIRDYNSGDNPRHIHWASLAKAGKLSIKEYHEEYFVRLGLIIDGEVSKDEASEQAFETALSLTASIADWIARKEYIIDIFATGNELYHFQAGRSIAHLENILEVLACLEPTEKVSMLQLASEIAPEIQQLSSLICVFLHWDQEREEFIHSLLNQGLGIKMILIQEQTPALPDEFIQMSTILKPHEWETVRL